MINKPSTLASGQAESCPSSPPVTAPRCATLMVDLTGHVEKSSSAFRNWCGYSAEELSRLSLDRLFAEPPFWDGLQRSGHWRGLLTLVSKDHQRRLLMATFEALTGPGDGLDGYNCMLTDPSGDDSVLSPRSPTVQVADSRSAAAMHAAFTSPGHDASTVRFEDLFDLDEVQRLQDLVSEAFGVASLITRPDGTPITQPSNFCDLCAEVVRTSPIGRENCRRSDATLGQFNPNGPTIRPCLSAGLWGAGAGIRAGGRHIANWVIGQVRGETQDEKTMLGYARELGVDEESYLAAYRRVPTMPPEQFERVAYSVYAVVNQLSDAAYRNLRLGRTLADLAQTEQALRESEQHYREAQQIARLGHWSFDAQTKCFLACSEVALELLGLEETGGQADYETLRSQIHPEDREAVDRVVSQAIATGERFTLSHRVVSANGDIRHLEVRGIAYTSSDGLVRRLGGTVMDVTVRTEVERELQRHREHLEELVAERTAKLQRAMSRLVQTEKLAALGSLVAGVAHELNTPLGNARMVASSMSDDYKGLEEGLSTGALRRTQLVDFLKRGQEALDLLEHNTARAANLINHFKEVAVDQTSVRRRRFSLRQTIEEVVSTLHPTLKHTPHGIQLEIPSDIALDSYPGPLEQVITNSDLQFTHSRVFRHRARPRQNPCACQGRGFG